MTDEFNEVPSAGIEEDKPKKRRVKVGLAAIENDWGLPCGVTGVVTGKRYRFNPGTPLYVDEKDAAVWVQRGTFRYSE